MIERTEHQVALILASDGIWEQLMPSNIPKVAINQIKTQIIDDRMAENIADTLLLRAISGWKKVKKYFFFF